MLADLLLRACVGPILELANSPRKDPGTERLRIALQDVIDGGTGIPPDTPSDIEIPLPEVRLRVMRDRTVPVVWALHLDDADEVSPQHFGVVALMARDSRSRLLRRCDWAECRAFFFASRNHRREHSFCSEGHRRLFDLANRDPHEAAQAMRDWRASKKAAEQRRRRAVAQKGKVR